MKHTACLALLSLALGCSSSSDTDGGTVTRGGSDGPGAASGCDHAGALCAKLAECAPFLLEAGYGDLDGCTARLIKVCTEQATSNGSGLSRANILACEAALQMATCNDVYGNNVPACSFRGTLADGATCGDHGQCATGFCSTGGNLCGTCSAKQPANATCASGSNDECQTGLVCSGGKICAAPAAVGGACDDTTAPCLLGSFCTTAGTCALTVAAGQECPGAYLNLGDGTVCLAKSTAAKPEVAGQIGTASVGQPCGLNPGNGLPATLCAPGGVPACTPTAGSAPLLGIPTKGICAALIADTGGCTAASACMAAAQCIGGTCRIPSGRYCE